MPVFLTYNLKQTVMETFEKELLKKVLIDAKDLFLKYTFSGMCWCIDLSLQKNGFGEASSYDRLSKIIPEFNKEKAKADFNAKDGLFWWSRFDFENRLKYFDFLINKYSE